MKIRSMFVLLAVLALSLSVSFAHGKKDSSKKAAATKSACCTTTPAEKISDKSLPPGHPKVDGMDECTDGDKANCDMSKSGKISMKSSDGKTIDCCKDKAKEANSKSGAKSKDAKGTN